VTDRDNKLNYIQAFKRTTEGAFFSHLLGILKLLEFRGPLSNMSGIGHSFFVQMRSYRVLAAKEKERKETNIDLGFWSSCQSSSYIPNDGGVEDCSLVRCYVIKAHYASPSGPSCGNTRLSCESRPV
jgi:hypothetical protein